VVEKGKKGKETGLEKREGKRVRGRGGMKGVGD